MPRKTISDPAPYIKKARLVQATDIVAGKYFVATRGKKIFGVRIDPHVAGCLKLREFSSTPDAYKWLEQHGDVVERTGDEPEIEELPAQPIPDGFEFRKVVLNADPEATITDKVRQFNEVTGLQTGSHLHGDRFIVSEPMPGTRERRRWSWARVRGGAVEQEGRWEPNKGAALQHMIQAGAPVKPDTDLARTICWPQHLNFSKV